MTDQHAEIVAAAISTYPPGVARPLFVEKHGDHAAVLLDTGGEGHPYPYFVLCQRGPDGAWFEGYSGNFPGWWQTEDDDGVVVFWGDTAGRPEPILVEFNGQRKAAEVRDGVFWAAWWDEQDPDNFIEPRWPDLVDAGYMNDSKGQWWQATSDRLIGRPARSEPVGPRHCVPGAAHLGIDLSRRRPRVFGVLFAWGRAI